MMSQTIQQRRRHPFSLEHLVPFAEGQVAGDQQAAPFVAIREHLEQQLGTGSAERKIAQFVADQQVRLVQSSQVTIESVLFLRFLQAIDERGGGEEADASPLPASSQAQCGCGVSLPLFPRSRSGRRSRYDRSIRRAPTPGSSVWATTR